jgi:hypothetical protein
MANFDPDEDETAPVQQLMNPQPNPRDNFLKAISQIESSGGTNLSHPTIQSGPQAGQTAIGQYGLLPHTIQELDNRNRLHQLNTPGGMSQPVPSRGPASVSTNEDLEHQYANQMADKVLNKFQDPNMAAYAWNKGHNLTSQQIQARDYMNDPYVQKFHKIWQSISNK